MGFLVLRTSRFRNILSFKRFPLFNVFHFSHLSPFYHKNPIDGLQQS